MHNVDEQNYFKGACQSGERDVVVEACAKDNGGFSTATLLHLAHEKVLRFLQVRRPCAGEAPGARANADGGSKMSPERARNGRQQVFTEFCEHVRGIGRGPRLSRGIRGLGIF